MYRIRHPADLLCFRYGRMCFTAEDLPGKIAFGNIGQGIGAHIHSLVRQRQNQTVIGWDESDRLQKKLGFTRAVGLTGKLGRFGPGFCPHPRLGGHWVDRERYNPKNGFIRICQERKTEKIFFMVFCHSRSLLRISSWEHGCRFQNTCPGKTGKRANPSSSPEGKRTRTEGFQYLP